MFPLNLEAMLISIVLSLFVGFGTGFYTEREFTLAGKTTAANAVEAQTAQAIQKSNVKSAQVSSAITKSDNIIASIKTAIDQRITNQIAKEKRANYEKRQTQENTKTANSQADPVLCNVPTSAMFNSAPWTLDLGTVRMLNDARTDAPVDAAAISDEKSNAPSTIGVKAFIDNDLQVVSMYQDLAKRHDALVDYVDSVLKQQAK